MAQTTRIGNKDDPNGGGGLQTQTYYGDQIRDRTPLTVQPSDPGKRKAIPRSVFDNRRGLLLTAEQLAGPPAPAYLLRRANVYGRQALL